MPDPRPEIIRAPEPGEFPVSWGDELRGYARLLGDVLSERRGSVGGDIGKFARDILGLGTMAVMPAAGAGGSGRPPRIPLNPSDPTLFQEGSAQFNRLQQFIRNVVKRYERPGPGSVEGKAAEPLVSRSELLNQGLTTLFEQLSNYEAKPNRTFEQWAGPVIRRGVGNYAANANRRIEVPSDIRAFNGAVHELIDRFYTRYGRQPNDDFLALKLWKKFHPNVGTSARPTPAALEDMKRRVQDARMGLTRPEWVNLGPAETPVERGTADPAKKARIIRPTTHPTEQELRVDPEALEKVGGELRARGESHVTTPDHERLNAVINALPEDWQQIYRARQGGKSFYEIAKERGANYKTINRLYKKIEDAVNQQLQREQGSGPGPRSVGAAAASGDPHSARNTLKTANDMLAAQERPYTGGRVPSDLGWVARMPREPERGPNPITGKPYDLMSNETAYIIGDPASHWDYKLMPRQDPTHPKAEEWGTPPWITDRRKIYQILLEHMTDPPDTGWRKQGPGGPFKEFKF